MSMSEMRKTMAKPHLNTPQGHVAFRLLSPTSAAGAIIGPSGLIQQRILRETGAFLIRVDDALAACNERVVYVLGPGKVDRGIILKDDTITDWNFKVSAAQAALVRVYEVMQAEIAAAPVRGRVRVDDCVRNCRLLVVSGGKVWKRDVELNKIERETGAFVRVLPPELLPLCADLDDELVQITGASLAVKKALIAVTHCLQGDWNKLSQSRASTPSGPSRDLLAKKDLCNVMKTSDRDQKLISDVDTREVVFRLICPVRASGSLVDWEETVIKNLEKETGASISVSPPLVGCDEIVIKVSAMEDKNSQFSPAQNAAACVFIRSMEDGGRSGHASGDVSSKAKLLIPFNQADGLDLKSNLENAEVQILDDHDLRLASADEKIIQIAGEISDVHVCLFQVTWNLREKMFSVKLAPKNGPRLPHEIFGHPPHINQTVGIVEAMDHLALSDRVNDQSKDQQSKLSPRDSLTVTTENQVDSDVCTSASSSELGSIRELPYEERVLACGLTLLFYREDHLPPDYGDAFLIVRVGKLNEEKSELCFTHLLEHILLRAADVHNDYLGFNEDHETLANHTTFGLPIDREHNIDMAIAKLAMIATQVKISKEHLDAEKDVVSVEHYERFEDPGFYTTYGVEHVIHDSINDEEVSAIEVFQRGLSSISVDQVRRYYKKWFKLSNMCLIIVGNCEFKDVLANSEMHFREENQEIEQIDNRVKDIRKGRKIKVINYEGIDASAFMIYQHLRNALKNPEDMMKRWDDKAAMFAFDRRMEHVWKSYIGGLVHKSGPHVLYVFKSGITDDTKEAKEVFSTLYEEVQRVVKYPFSETHIKAARQVVFEKLEAKTRKFSSNVKFRCSRMFRKLRNKFLYGDGAFHPSSKLAVAREWLISDSRRSSFNFLDECKLYIIVNQLSLDMEAVKGEILRVNDTDLSEPSDNEEDNSTDEFDKVVGSLCNNQLTTPTKISYNEIRLQEWTLSNGMKVAYHRLDHVDECSLHGFAYGGLSESRDNQISHKYASIVATVLRTSGGVKEFKDSSRVEISTDIGIYTRSFDADFRACRLEMVLQKVHLLFITNEVPGDDVVKQEDIRSAIVSAIERKGRLEHHALKTARGANTLSTIPTTDDEPQIDRIEACNFFNACFCDPSQFTVVIVGDLGEIEVENTIMKYLDSIPRKESLRSFPRDPYKLSRIPIQFPKEVDRDVIYCLSSTMLTKFFINIPVSLDTQNLDTDKLLAERLMLLMEDCLVNHLRDELFSIYYVTSGLEYDGSSYASRNGELAIITFYFPALDKDTEFVKLLLNESIKALENFRLMGPAKLGKLEENDDVKLKLLEAYHFATADRNVESTYKAHEETRKEIAAMEIKEWRKEINRMCPVEFSTKHVAAVIRPYKG